MATLQQRKVKGLTDFAVFDKSVSPKLAYILDTPTGAELDLGIEEQLNETTSQLGEIVIESSFISAQRPIMNLTFPGSSPTAIALRTGRKLVSATRDWAVEKRIRLTNSNKTQAARTSGQEGFGMTADQTTSQAWVLSGQGIPVALTRVDTASFSAGNSDEFSQGADFAYQFTDNLVGSDVMFSFPLASQTVLEVGEDPLDDLEINFTAVMRDLKLFRVSIPSASIDFAGSGNIPIGAGELTINVRITYDGSTCYPIKYEWLDQVRAC